MKKTAQILAVVCLLLAGGSAPLRAQLYDNYIHHPLDKRLFQRAVYQATFPCWPSLKASLTGDYARIEDLWKKAQPQKAERQCKKIQSFYPYTPPLEGYSSPQQAALARELHSLPKRQHLYRYNTMQKMIASNRRIFPGYVLLANSVLMELNEKETEVLKILFEGTNAQNTPSFRFVQKERVVTISLENSNVKVIIDGEDRTILITRQTSD